MLNRNQLRREAIKFSKLNSTEDLANLLKMNLEDLITYSHNPRYRRFSIRKNEDETRLIEDPVDGLKRIQRGINFFLQANYNQIKSACVHGFVLATKGEDSRNIVTNARCHLQSEFIFKLDLHDFFHQVRSKMIKELFELYFKEFNDELLETLVRICNYNKRLPMGAPTSPVLSNYALFDLDLVLQDYSRDNNWVFTRYADDFVFSSTDEIKGHQVEDLKKFFIQRRWKLNESKTKLFGKDEIKTITGIVLRNGRLDLQPDFLSKLDIEIRRYRAYLEVESRYSQRTMLDKLKIFEDELNGKLQFAKQVIPEDQHLIELQDKFEGAKQIFESYETVDWLDLDYRFY